MRALLVLNPRARVAADKSRATTGVSGEELVAALHALGVETHLHVSASPEGALQAAHEAVAAGFDAVIAGGGDGTVNSIVGALVDTPVALGVIPLGTANVAAGRAGVTTGDVEGACQVIAAGKTRAVDVGVANGRHFLAMAGLGLDAQVAATVDARSKQSLGRIAYAGTFLKTALTSAPRSCRLRVVTSDGVEEVREERLWGVIVCNAPMYTWRLKLVPDAEDDDGALDFVLLHAHGRLALLSLAYQLFVAQKPAYGRRNVTVLRAQSVTAECGPVALWQTDGDVIAETPVAITVKPKALKQIVRGD
jgi:diacylglycerol kinase (ATP)